MNLIAKFNPFYTWSFFIISNNSRDSR